MIDPVIEAIRAGEPVILPTDTVYGLAADAFQEGAVRALYRLKRRGERQPTALLAASADVVYEAVPELEGQVLPRGGYTWILPNPARRLRWLTGLLLLAIFCSFGVVVGVYAESWDQSAFVTNLVILPLSFLGGVFYSVDLLPSPWHELSHVNPIFFIINSVRYGFLGTSDVPVEIALAVTAALALACALWSAAMFRSGRRLKP